MGLKGSSAKHPGIWRKRLQEQGEHTEALTWETSWSVPGSKESREWNEVGNMERPAGWGVLQGENPGLETTSQSGCGSGWILRGRQRPGHRGLRVTGKARDCILRNVWTGESPDLLLLYKLVLTAKWRTECRGDSIGGCWGNQGWPKLLV